MGQFLEKSLFADYFDHFYLTNWEQKMVIFVTKIDSQPPEQHFVGPLVFYLTSLLTSDMDFPNSPSFLHFRYKVSLFGGLRLALRDQESVHKCIVTRGHGRRSLGRAGHGEVRVGSAPRAVCLQIQSPSLHSPPPVVPSSNFPKWNSA
jgi:hypothetical protein